MSVFRRHFFADMRPYVCTMLNCQNPLKLYATRHEWQYHEMQMHRRQWICAEPCGYSTNCKENFRQHLSDRHERRSYKEQVFLLDICEGPMEEKCETTCPICVANMSLGELYPHLGAHLEELALFVLPNSSNGQDESRSSTAKTLLAPSTRGSFSSTRPTSITEEMDPATAFQLAYGAIELVELCIKTSKAFFEIYRSSPSSPADAERFDRKTALLDKTTSRLSAHLVDLKSLNTSFTRDQKEVYQIAGDCERLSRDVLGRLQSFKPSSPLRKRDIPAQWMKFTREKSKIEKAHQELLRYHKILGSEMLISLW